MNENTAYLEQSFLKCENLISEGEYDIVIENEDLFYKKYVVPYEMETTLDIFGDPMTLEEYFNFDNKKIVDYVSDYLTYKWFKDAGDLRYKEFSMVLEPITTDINLKNIPFIDFLYFISPESKKNKFTKNAK